MSSAASLEPAQFRVDALPVTSPKKKALRGTATHVEIHDPQQLEIRHGYSLASDHGRARYLVETFFFIPRNVGLNRANYTKEQFYADVTPLIRLDATPLSLERLADASDAASPLHRFKATLEALRTQNRPPPTRAVVIHVKLYAYLFTLGVKADLSRLLKHTRQADEAARTGVPRYQEVEVECEVALARIRKALWAYRSVRAAFWPFEKMSHQSLPEAMRVADEYMSAFLDERLAKHLAAIERVPERYDGSGFVARYRQRITALATEEAKYRMRYGYLTLSERDVENAEYFSYRSSLIKKAVQQALYLDPRGVPADTYLRNAVGAVGAALAAIWALATQLPATLADVSGTTKFWFFASAVAAYVLKDRIKAVTNEVLTGRLRRYDHTSVLTGESLEIVGLAGLKARLRESMRYLDADKIPAEVSTMRLETRTVRNAAALAEEVIHYRKSVEFGGRPASGEMPAHYWIRDTLRLNVRHFLVKLDEPTSVVSFFDSERGTFASAQVPKVYHLNVVTRMVRQSEDGTTDVHLERLRVVLNKNGIVRVVHVESREEHKFPADGRGRDGPSHTLAHRAR